MKTLSICRCFYFAFACFPFALTGGQSLALSPNAPTIILTDPHVSEQQSWRVEFQIHDWAFPNSGQTDLFTLNGLGALVQLRSEGRISLVPLGTSVAQQEPCYVNLLGLTNAVVRFQKDVGKMQVRCEVWNYDGTGYNSTLQNITALLPSSYIGGTIGGSTASIGFIRAFTTVVPAGGRPPTTADAGDWTELKFDGNLDDSSGNGHGGVGTARYGVTSDQVPTAYPKTMSVPSWTNSVSLRAGFPAQLDGSASFSLADSSSTVSYIWKQIAGPTSVIWQNPASATPTITGLIFGPYTFQLTVTDCNGITSTTTLETGAVATDNNGIVVNANPAADALFGPMIAFGRNPWGWADARNYAMENLQKNTYAIPPSWANPVEANTVDYQFFDPVGTGPRAALSVGLAAGAMSIDVVNPGQLDLTSMPTQILIGAPAAWEIVRICSASGARLVVCYDGRGFHSGGDGRLRPASDWPAGTNVWQAKVTGHGTHFLTTMCSLGAGWQTASNPVSSSGTITVLAGSPAGVGTGTSWTATENWRAIAVYGTHGGTTFTFYAYVTGVSGNALQFSRPFPSDADSGTYSYRIFSDNRSIVLHYRRLDGSDGSIYFPTAGCESDASLYLYFGWDNGYANQAVSSSSYSYIDGGYVGDFSPNYYDLGLAHYAFYFRSGYATALTAARSIEDYWLRYPEIAQGDAGGSPRSRSITGVFAAAVLDGDRASNWSGLRTFAREGIAVANGTTCSEDTRESAYQLSWLALAAMFDPDPSQRAIWQAAMAVSYNRDNNCKGPDNSFASDFYWTASNYPSVVTTTGSSLVKSVTGSIPPGICFGTAKGTALVSNGSPVMTALSGSFAIPPGDFSIVVGGFLHGVRYDMSAQFDLSSPTSLTLSAPWPGDAGTAYWMITGNNPNHYIVSIAGGPSDTANFGAVTACMQTDKVDTFTMHRPWSTTGGTYGLAAFNLLGHGVQPFMVGIKTLQMRFGALTYAPYQTLAGAAANWVGTTGFDPLTKAIYYGRGFPVCEPALTDSGIVDVPYRNPSCIENSHNPDFLGQARARNAEAQNAMSVMYLASRTPSNLLTGDWFYGATYGAPGYTSNGYFTDGKTASNLDDGSLAGYKWPGFFFGIGMAHQWPAARLGGVAAAQNRAVSIKFTLGSAASATLIVTAPSGAQTTYPCGAVSPCTVTVDDRQGSHWISANYLSSSGQIVFQSAPVLLGDKAASISGHP